MTDYWSRFILVITTVALADVCWVNCVSNVKEDRAFASAIWAVGIMVAGSFSVYSYISNPTYIIASCIGAFLGTYITVKYK